ncbi:hypothetical protein QYF36_018306 [Acer negundo]|nr:hypothetical protein QYF36_018306 [Acer negundo]
MYKLIAEQRSNAINIFQSLAVAYFMDQDNKMLLEELPTCVVDFAPKTSNKGAHGLATLGLSVETDMFWLEECPPCLRQVV